LSFFFLPPAAGSGAAATGSTALGEGVSLMGWGLGAAGTAPPAFFFAAACVAEEWLAPTSL